MPKWEIAGNLRCPPATFPLESAKRHGTKDAVKIPRKFIEKFIMRINSAEGWKAMKGAHAGWFNGNDEEWFEKELYPVRAEQIGFGLSVVNIVETDGLWGRVETMDVKGSVPDPEEINYRLTPWLVHKFIAVCPRFKPIKLGNERDAYIALITKNDVWIELSEAEKFPDLPMEVEVKVNSIYVRSEPERSDLTGISGLRKGERVTIVEYAPRGPDVWGRIQRPGTPEDNGWIALQWHTQVGGEYQRVFYTSWKMNTPPPPIGMMDISNIPPADGLPSDGGVVSNKETLFGGRAVYYKEDRAHILVVHRDGVKFLVTPPKDASGLLIPMKTSEFLDTYKLSIAINGGGFTLQADGSAKPKGFVMSKGRVYSDEIDGVTMYIRRNNTVAFSRPTGTIYQAVSGDRMLVEKGIPTPGEENTVSPRTAIGLSRGEARLILLVVDGNEAEGTGATYAEIAALIKKYGAYKAMALDGGGSSTMVVKDKDGPRILNIPSDDNVPGRERPVATHLGIAFKKKRKKED